MTLTEQVRRRLTRIAEFTGMPGAQQFVESAIEELNIERDGLNRIIAIRLLPDGTTESVIHVSGDDGSIYDLL